MFPSRDGRSAAPSREEANRFVFEQSAAEESKNDDWPESRSEIGIDNGNLDATGCTLRGGAGSVVLGDGRSGTAGAGRRS
jgi:hypothetical protein